MKVPFLGHLALTLLLGAAFVDRAQAGNVYVDDIGTGINVTGAFHDLIVENDHHVSFKWDISHTVTPNETGAFYAIMGNDNGYQAFLLFTLRPPEDWANVDFYTEDESFTVISTAMNHALELGGGHHIISDAVADGEYHPLAVMLSSGNQFPVLDTLYAASGHTPEPASVVLFGGGLLAAAFVARRRKV